MASKFARVPLIMGAAAAVATMVAGTAQAASATERPAVLANIVAAPQTAAQPADYGGWILQGPYGTGLACDNQWTSVSSRRGVQATSCQYGSGNPAGWYFYFRVWY